MADFFAMGGYGFYVWSAYGVAALVVDRRAPRASLAPDARCSPRRDGSDRAEPAASAE